MIYLRFFFLSTPRRVRILHDTIPSSSDRNQIITSSRILTDRSLNLFCLSIRTLLLNVLSIVITSVLLYNQLETTYHSLDDCFLIQRHNFRSEHSRAVFHRRICRHIVKHSLANRKSVDRDTHSLRYSREAQEYRFPNRHERLVRTRLPVSSRGSGWGFAPSRSANGQHYVPCALPTECLGTAHHLPRAGHGL